jgi:hypothetical protein
MLIFTIMAPAMAGFGVPLPAALGADLIFRGTVQNISQCVVPDGSLAWTFVQFTVQDTILGSYAPFVGEPANRMTIRIPAGTMPDGSRSAIEGMPAFAVGDQFIVPVFAASGTPGFLPFPVFGDGAYFRIFPDANGGTVVTADGRILQTTSVGVPLPGPIFPAAHSVEPGGFPAGVDEGAVATAVSQYRSGVGYDGVHPPSGPWTGRLRIKSTGLAHVDGVGFFSAAGDCNAVLSGSYDGTTLHLTGWCNAPEAGRLDINLEGSRTSGHWSGLLAVHASFDSSAGGLFTWNDQPWSSDHDYPDGFTANSVQLSPQVPEQYQGTFELQNNPSHDVSFIATYGGWRTPMTITQFSDWLGTTATNGGNEGRVVHSLQNNAANCVDMPVVHQN